MLEFVSVKQVKHYSKIKKHNKLNNSELRFYLVTSKDCISYKTPFWK